jgi:hypothetical protein
MGELSLSCTYGLDAGYMYPKVKHLQPCSFHEPYFLNPVSRIRFPNSAS